MLVIVTRDYNSYSRQGLSCVNHYQCLTLNNSLIWCAMEIGVSNNKFLIFFLQALDFSVSHEEITVEKVSTLQNSNMVLLVKSLKCVSKDTLKIIALKWYAKRSVISSFRRETCT